MSSLGDAFLTLVAIALLAPSEGSGQSYPVDVGSRLVLSQTNALSFPDTIFVRGAAVAENGLTVIWSAGTPAQVMVADTHSLLGTWSIEVPHPILSAALINDLTIELLTPRSLVTARISEEDAVITRDRGLMGDVIGGVYTPRGWVMLEANGSEVRLLDLDGRVLWRDVGTSVEHWHIRYAAEADVLVLARERAPFRMILVDIASQSSQEWMEHHSRIARAAKSHGITTLDHWVSLAAINVGGRFLQTMTDPGSDRRLVIIYERDGSYVQSLLVVAPIGFHATVPFTRQVLAFRRINIMALVRYEWRWGRTPLLF